MTSSNIQMVRVYEQTLTDGSHVYGVVAGDQKIDCATLDDAEALANEIDRLSTSHQYDGWDRVQLAA
jgi:hypothetical protein